MSGSSPVETFLTAVQATLGARSADQMHALAVAAKKVRLAVESGTTLTDSAWVELFPDARVRAFARDTLTPVSIVDLDFDATVFHTPATPPTIQPPSAAPNATLPTASPATAPSAIEPATHTMAASPEALQRKWHALLASIPDEGLPADDGSGVINGMELGRLIIQVSQAKGRASFRRLPTAAGFRERFLDAARDAQRLDLIDDMPNGA